MFGKNEVVVLLTKPNQLVVNWFTAKTLLVKVRGVVLAKHINLLVFWLISYILKFICLIDLIVYFNYNLREVGFL